MRTDLPGLASFTNASEEIVTIQVISTTAFDDWLSKQPVSIKKWLTTSDFKPKHRAFTLLPDTEAGCRVLLTLEDFTDCWALADLPYKLPVGDYLLESTHSDSFVSMAIGWGLGAYRFRRYKNKSRLPARLMVTDETIYDAVSRTVSACTLVRDLINTPAEDMSPPQLADATKKLADEHGAICKVIVGDNLLEQHYPAIYQVGRASMHPPRLIDLRWGATGDPEIVLIGKGVCFDTGGLDLKPSRGMRHMKKDMGGAAHVLGLAQLIMSENLPVRLRVLIPAVENAVSGNAYRPGDVLSTRKGLTVEIDNTDAEGRLVLCDALTAAHDENPELIIDFATLTGAARVALGTELPVFFTRNESLAQDLLNLGKRSQDPLWQLPLYDDYSHQLESEIADLLNCSASPFGGAITAALFLESFVSSQEIDWLHIDLMGWNIRKRPGRPLGGEAMGMRAVFAYIEARFGKNDG